MESKTQLFPLIYNKIYQYTRLNKKFKRKQIIAEFSLEHNFGSIDNFFDVSAGVDETFNEIVDSLVDDTIPDNYLISAEIIHKDLSYNIYVPPQFKSLFKAGKLLSSIENVVQSNKKFIMDGTLKLEVCITENVSGSGKPKTKAPIQIKEKSKAKRSVISINNTDNSCGYRALFVSKYYKDNEKSLIKTEWQCVRKDKNKSQTKGAFKIAYSSGLQMDIPVDMTKLNLIQEYLKGYQIICIDGYSHEIIYKGPIAIKKLYIENYNNHFNAIINIKAYIGSIYYCESCHVGYSNRHKHVCIYLCKKCGTNCDKNTNIKIRCYVCFRSFHGQHCYQQHLITGICNKVKKCELCSITYKSNHICLHYKCKTCKDVYLLQPHICSMKIKNESKLIEEDNIKKIIVCYDIESSQENGIHKPMLLVSKSKCDLCYTNFNSSCDLCKETVYFGYDCVNKFVSYLFLNLAKKAIEINAVIYAFAHNARGYDAHFILKEVYSMAFDKIDLIMNGRKILKLAVGNVVMLDSLSFFLLPLSKLPEAFGLSVDTKKDIFPHYFNQQCNWNYIGKIPDINYYKPELLKLHESNYLKTWHSKKVEEKYIFNFKQEIIAYCKNDVDILLKCVNIFRFNFISITNIDPITRCFTLASIGLEIFKTKYLTEDILGITKIDGYSVNRNYSFKSSSWLDWEQKLNGISITREYRFGKYFADGFDTINICIYEFLGCHWHGCKKCYLIKRDEPVVNQNSKLVSYNYLYENTCKKFDLYNKLGIKYITFWECEFDDLQKNNNQFKIYTNQRINYYKRLKKFGNAKINEAFFGGRTNNLKFYHECSLDEEIKCVDFNSIYPCVMKSKNYPIKHPEVISENFDYSLKSYFGFVKCKVLPPRGLYFPVLPLTINKKLYFPLCLQCSKNMLSSCKHNEEERCLINTWTTPELLLAIEKGYKIIEIIEVLHYSHSSECLFEEYMNTWLKIKQESSGWPSDCQTEKQKDLFVKEFEIRTGIKLNKNKICNNASLRFIAKLMCNVLWGKLAQRPNLSKTEIVSSYDQYWKLITDYKKDITGINEANEHQLVVNWSYKDIKDGNSGNYILSIAAFVTSYARIELYKKIDLLEKASPNCVLLFDTDSIYYVKNKHNAGVIKCGNLLGDLTDEIKKNYGENSKCTKLVSLGPKNYGFEVVKPDCCLATEFKIKGITINENALNVISFSKMLDMATNFNNKKYDVVNVPQLQIRPDKNHNVNTHYIEKKYKAVYTKRYISNHNETLPYGY